VCVLSKKNIQSEVTFVPTEVTRIVFGMVLQMHLQARQFLLGSVFLGDQWMQFLHYASVRVRAGWVIPPLFSEWTRSLFSKRMGSTAIWRSSKLSPAQNPGDEDLGSLASSLPDKIR
jgi:hypothetical protein